MSGLVSRSRSTAAEVKFKTRLERLAGISEDLEQDRDGDGPGAGARGGPEARGDLDEGQARRREQQRSGDARSRKHM